MSMRTPLGRVRGLGPAKSGTEHFWRQRLTAVANVPLSIAFVLIVGSLVGRNHAAVVQILGSPLVAVIFLVLGAVNIGVVGWQLVTFGRLMHRIIEAVAQQAQLMPADPISRALRPIGAPRTV